MAWVLERAGAIGLVERVARSANNATIAELSRDAELLHWLDELGMTPGEAGLVQPSYCFYKKGDCLCRQTSGAWPSADQVVTGVVLSHDAGTTFPVRVETLLGGDARTAVGDELSIDGTATGGTNVLVALIHGDGGPIIALRIPAERAGETVCGDPAFGIAIDRSDVVNALLAKDCLAALGAKDARFLEPVCTDAFETGTVSDATASDSGTRDASADSRASTTDAATGDAGDPSVAASQSSGCAMHGFERSDAPVVIALVATVIVSRRLRRARR